VNDETEGSDRESLGDMIDLATRRMMIAIIVAGAAIGLALYSRPGPPRFQAFATPNGIVRIDTRNGTVIACEAGRCMLVVRHGQHLDAYAPTKALPATPPKP
jgi:hypothetical protein